MSPDGLLPPHAAPTDEEQKKLVGQHYTRRQHLHPAHVDTRLTEPRGDERERGDGLGVRAEAVLREVREVVARAEAEDVGPGDDGHATGGEPEHRQDR